MASPVAPDSPAQEMVGDPAAVSPKVKKTKNKAKLAMSVAATFGVMLYYTWREKRLQKKDPEEFARLQRLKASIHACDEQADK